MKKYESFRRHVLAVPFELVMLGGVVATLGQGNWKHFAASLFTLGISFAPLVAERWWRIKMPLLLQTIYVAFIFVSMFAGEVLGMYGRIWIWDDVTHAVSGLLVGLAVMLWLRLRQKQSHVPVWLGAVLIFCMVATAAVLWEIVEFASDELFGTFSQGADLFDTMMDLIYEAGSGLIMAIAWVFHAQGKNIFIISPIISQFERLNKSAL